MDNKEIKIIYDISALCACRYITGIPRVIEETARGFFRHPECKFIFSVNLNNYPYAKKYLEKFDYFPEYRISKPEMVRPFSFFVDGIGYCSVRRREIQAMLKGDSKHKFMLKVYDMFLRCARKAMTLFVINDMSEKDCRRADIYHSACFNLPEFVRKYGNLSVFQTIHDIIPIVCPQYCSESATQRMKIYINRLVKNDFLLCVSHATRNDLLNYSDKFDPERVLVIHLAASEKFYPCESPEEIKAVKKRYKIPADSRYILSVATLEPRKNLHTLIRSFVQLVISEKINDLSLVLTGVLGWNYGKIFREIEDTPAKIRDRIIFTGYVSDVDLSPLYTGALTFVYPGFYEGFGLPPLEAMQCGAPVIVSNTSSLPEVVGDAGIMVNPDDVTGWSGAIRKVYSSESLRKIMSRSSRERAKLFSWEKYVDQTASAYKKAIAAR